VKLSKGDTKNFNTLQRASGNGDLALMDARRRADGKSVALVCAVQHEADESVTMVPLAIMVEGDPYELFDPPDPDTGGYVTPS
jgi:hypothetical protein